MARFDAATGRYVYLTIDGVEYRIYFEEAGAGIPLLLQHTAGADSRQWRHLLQDRDIGRHFRLIAYDRRITRNPCRRPASNGGRRSTRSRATSS
jgi:hypothetical protein